MGLVADHGAIGVTTDDPARAIGIAGRDTVAEGEAPAAIALFGRELVRTPVAVMAAAEQGVVVADDMLAAALALQDDVHDNRITLHVDAGRASADKFDPLDLTGRGAAQNVRDRVTLGCGASVVDQGVADRAFEAPAARAVVQTEAGDSADHVQRGVRPLVGEEIGGEDQNATLVGVGQRRGGGRTGRNRRLGDLGFGRGQGGRGGEKHGRAGQKNGLGHRLGFPSSVARVVTAPARRLQLQDRQVD